jgi:hypothetical protein
MRVAALATILLLAACATDSTSLTPPPGVDFSGRWKLNAADSDDPMHLLQIASGRGDDGTGSAGTSGGGRGGRGGGPGTGYPGMAPPQTPSVGALGAGLRWPGKLLDVQQVGGVVTFSSNGKNRVCQPSSGDKKPRHHPPDRSSSDRDAPLRSEREEAPPHCTWLDKTLVVRSEPDEDHLPYEERYSISEDRQRLIEIVGFRGGGRSSGFTMSRVWDRVPQ